MYQPYIIEVVTETVRRTGQSAHPQAGELVSPLVRRVAAQLEMPATLLQVEVERWADHVDGVVRDTRTRRQAARDALNIPSARHEGCPQCGGRTIDHCRCEDTRDI